MSRQLIGLVACSLALTACSGHTTPPVGGGRDLPPVLLYEHPWIDVYEEGFQLGFQSWGPQPVSP